MKLPICLILAIATATAQQPAAATRPDALHDLSAQLEALSHRVSRAVVQIFATGYVVNDERESGSNTAIVTRQRATGSGVVVSADGYIVTKAHAVSNARKVRVRIADEAPDGANGPMRPSGKMLEATVVGVDRETDLAVLKVDRGDLS